MDSKAAFAHKARHYAKYRWGYAFEAVEQIIAISGIGANSVVADIGAGTGILSRHFTGRAWTIFAIEPNQAMRQEAERLLSEFPDCVVVDASAETTGLPDHSVDLITVGQAAHWFQAKATREEFRRILKPGGWLALLRNTNHDDEVYSALRDINTPEYGVMPVHPAPSNHVLESYYFEGGSCRTIDYPIRIEQNLEQFIGAALSASFTPDETSPYYEGFIKALRDIFNRHCPDGIRLVTGASHLVIGQPAGVDASAA